MCCFLRSWREKKSVKPIFEALIELCSATSLRHNSRLVLLPTGWRMHSTPPCSPRVRIISPTLSSPHSGVATISPPPLHSSIPHSS